MRLLVQSPSLSEVFERLLKGSERHTAININELMGERNKWIGIAVHGQGFEHRQIVVAKRCWNDQSRLPNSLQFRIHAQTGYTTVAVIEGMHFSDQKKDVKGASGG